jgi:hypothetical protein
METKFKVGDKVILKNLDGPYLIEHLSFLINKLCTIKYAEIAKNAESYYILKEDMKCFNSIKAYIQDHNLIPANKFKKLKDIL